MNIRNLYVRVVIVVGIVVVLLSVVTPPFGTGPDEWLIGWTAWAMDYVGVAAAAYGVVKIADGVAYRLSNQRDPHGGKAGP